MGMFDYVHYKGDKYQSKYTPSQGLDNYKIEQDQDSGHWFLWHEEYDSEWIEDGGFLGGHIHDFNHRWVHCDKFIGEIKFYRPLLGKDEWLEYSAYFKNGILREINEL